MEIVEVNIIVISDKSNFHARYLFMIIFWQVFNQLHEILAKYIDHTGLDRSVSNVNCEYEGWSVRPLVLL